MCKKWYNETVRGIWGEGPTAPTTAPQGPTAAELAAQEQQRRDAESQQRLLDEAKQNDRRRGRRATVVSGVVGDQTYGTNITGRSAYSMGSGATRLGG